MRANAGQARAGLHEIENLEQRARCVHEHIVARDLDEAMTRLKALIDGARSFAFPVVENGFREQLKQNIVKRRQRLDITIISLHELLDSQAVLLVFVAEHLGNLDLVIEQQPVFGAISQGMQGKTHPP